MTNHVPTLENCKKLNEAGFPQKTKNWWSHLNGYPQLVSVINESDRQPELDSEFTRYAAPTLTEIVEDMKSRFGDFQDVAIGYHYMQGDDRGIPYAYFIPNPVVGQRLLGENLADAMANLWLHEVKILTMTEQIKKEVDGETA